MADEKKQSAVVTIRASGTGSLPAGFMGFADLLTPKQFGDDPAKFNLDYHINPDAVRAIPLVIQAKCYDAHLEALYVEVLENGGKKKPAMDPEEWLEAKLKPCKEKSKVQLPFFKLHNNGFRRGRDGGAPVQNVMGCWDKDNNPLDLASLRLAKGSVIQPIVYFNLFAAKASMWVPQPSLKLVGIRVLKAVQYGSGGGAARPPEADDEAIKAVMGADFVMDDDLANLGHDEAIQEEPDTDTVVKGAF